MEDVYGSISKPFKTGEFQWSIIVCSDEIFDFNSYLASPTFSFLNCSWYVRMYPRGAILSSKKWIFYLMKKKSQSEVNMEFSFSMLFEDKPLVNSYGTYTFNESVIGCCKGRSFLLQNNHRSIEIKDYGELCIKIKLNQITPSKEDTLLEVKRHGEDMMLSKNYKGLLLHDKKHDLILKVKDREFKVHQKIMRFRCPVFKLMLAHDMLERNTGVVEIPDCDPSAFEQFLFYVYTGHVEVLDESVMLSLYYIADKYDMTNLKESCCKFIKVSLSAHNVCDVIRLALNHSDSSLLESGGTYISIFLFNYIFLTLFYCVITFDM